MRISDWSSDVCSSDLVSDRMDKGFSIYLSTPPSLFAPTAMALKKAGLTGPNSRIAMEKPIGHDLPSCREVNEVMGSIFDEDRIFRVDHYLGKERSDERRVGKECVRTCRSRWSP